MDERSAPGSLDGQVALITGGARGQGRSHAVALAAQGADIVICDIAASLKTPPYPGTTPADLDETQRMVEEQGRRCLSVQADVRASDELTGAVDTAIRTFGKIDILLANAGIGSFGPLLDLTDDMWDETIDVNLSGTFKTIRAVGRHMVDRGYGRIVATSSVAGRQGQQNLANYCASKWGILGLVKTAALEFAAFGVTVNAICPTNVNTPMLLHDASPRLFRPDLANPTVEDMMEPLTALNAIPVPWIEPEDVSAAVLYLVSPGARYVTGAVIDVAAGWNARYTG